MATIIDSSEAVRLLQSEQSKKDAKINEILTRIVNGTESLEDDDVPLGKKYDLILSNEYLLTRLRFLLADEMTRVEHALTIANYEPTVKSFFNKRKTYLSALNQRLFEIREDLNVLSRLTYNRF